MFWMNLALKTRLVSETRGMMHTGGKREDKKTHVQWGPSDGEGLYGRWSPRMYGHRLRSGGVLSIELSQLTIGNIREHSQKFQNIVSTTGFVQVQEHEIIISCLAVWCAAELSSPVHLESPHHP